MVKLLLKPSEERIKDSNLYRFIQFVNSQYHKDIHIYARLYQWSVGDIAGFFSSLRG
jgi:acetoacetyl-CoA synthetase